VFLPALYRRDWAGPTCPSNPDFDITHSIRRFRRPDHGARRMKNIVPEHCEVPSVEFRHLAAVDAKSVSLIGTPPFGARKNC